MTDRGESLGERLRAIEEWKDQRHGAVDQLDSFRTRIESLEGWRRWVIGSATTAGLIVGFLVGHSSGAFHWP